MNLTKGQQQGLEMGLRLKTYTGTPRIAVLAGYAGVGKTTLLKMLTESWGEKPRVVAPTGKAALRVRELTGLRATTIHSWIYNPEEDPNTGEVTYKRKAAPEMQGTLPGVPILVIDEASMVGPDLWEDIHDSCCMLGLNILIIGDSFQLPPVQKRNPDQIIPRSEFNLLSPDFRSDERVQLTEIVRQALDNPIVRASMLVREGDPAQAMLALPRISNQDLIRVGAEALQAGNSVVVCHKNETRQRLNVRFREAMGLPADELRAGEPLLVLQNNYQLERFNGEIAHFRKWVEPPAGEHTIKDWMRKQEAKSRFGIAQLDPIEGDDYAQVILSTAQVWGQIENLALPPIIKTGRVVLGFNADIDPQRLLDMTVDERRAIMGPPHLHANFGYCLTAFKAQGSEWDHIICCIEPSIRLGTEDGRRFLYTAITRSRKSIQLVLGTGRTL